jgi:glycosidase
VAAESTDHFSMLSLTQRLLTMRRGSSALSLGSYRPIADVPSDCFVYLRQAGDERLLIALNFSDREQQVTLPGWTGTVMLSTHLDREGPADLANLTLRPNEGCVVEVNEAP